VRGVLAQVGQRHLVRTPVALGALAVHLLRAGPALRRAQTIIGQAGRSTVPARRSRAERLDVLDLVQRSSSAVGHRLVRGGVVLGSATSTVIGRYP
jgi:hypothetical protein